ncbi:Transposase DDE domain-containing protein [Persephonella hydrogeniphila]|uniref:Transposase DDE domain-containing protein n=1 Tax=Persephonella hydrogeniphila TaxID=198703 RepID=A0A285NA62_9AQUI|nr:IS982 family transposase [Persephonella hydrogeniphila]SNZ06208.1 Transposase DDE domain-containing protein [Persephonella hydrogeniphila]
MLITKIYCQLDDFYKSFENYLKQNVLPKSSKGRKSKLTITEISTILVLFHLSGYSNLKRFYKEHALIHLKSYFPDLVSYNRFVELIPSSISFLYAFLKFTTKLNVSCRFAFVDSTKLPVCENSRIHSHKVFEGLAQRGKDTVGWFYGFKLHLIINEKGQILSFDLTAGNIDDRKSLRKMMKDIKGKVLKIFGDRGYISQSLSKEFLSNGIHLIAKLRKNMKGKLLSVFDYILSTKRALVESVNSILKEQLKIDHTRHRSPVNFIANLLSGLVAYHFKENKPKIDLSFNFKKDALLLV